jgi:HlyD family secretion protein
VNQARADVDSARAAVLNQEAQVERARADVDNARAALVEAKAFTAKAQVQSVDAKRDYDRRPSSSAVQLIAKSDLDTSQATYDAAVPSWTRRGRANRRSGPGSSRRSRSSA